MGEHETALKEPLYEKKGKFQSGKKQGRLLQLQDLSQGGGCSHFNKKERDRGIFFEASHQAGILEGPGAGDFLDRPRINSRRG